MGSLRGRLTLTIAGLALLAVVAVTVTVAVTTSDSIEETLDEQRVARSDIVEILTEEAIGIERWADAQPLAADLAEEYEARIALTDIDGRRLLDTGDGELPPLEGVIDPFGPLAEFGDEAPFDESAFDEALFICLEEEGIPYVVDDFGEVFILEGEDDLFLEAQIEECYEAAIDELEGGIVSLKEPALLFIGFSSAPSIPWVPIGIIAALVIAAAAAAAAPLSGFVTRSLRSLTAAARSIREGNLDVRVDPATPTEVADLATSFNEMTEELSRAETRRKQLTADVAHELRSPLTNILSHLDAIEDGVIEPSPDQVQIITSEAVRLSHLVDDLQTLAALDEETLTLSFEPTELAAALDAAVEARRGRAIDQGLAMHRAGGESELVRIDTNRFGQIVGNLLDNAIEHTPTGGTITVEASATNDHATVAVTDTGHGIDPSLLPFVFDRLSRADESRSPRRGGRGLGLSIARGLAQAHGGDITVDLPAGGGARFTISIPLGGDKVSATA